jgi:hypothetical protein
MRYIQYAPDWFARKEFRILKKLKSIAVFVAKQLQGIEGIPALKLQFKPDMPAVHISAMLGN